MPIPSPHKDQNQEEFISSCMGHDMMNEEYPDNKQRAAVCYAQWKRKSEKKSKGQIDSVNFQDQIINDILLLD